MNTRILMWLSLCLLPFMLGCLSSQYGAVKRPVLESPSPMPEGQAEQAALQKKKSSASEATSAVEPLSSGSVAKTEIEAEAEMEKKISFLEDLPESEIVEMYYTYYSKKHKTTFSRWLDRARPYLPWMAQIFKENGLPQELIFLPFAESGFNSWAYSRTGAGGMWQFMPATARSLGLKVDWWLDERRDPYKATEAAAEYLKYLHDKFDDWTLVLAAYNSGEGTVRRAVANGKTRDFFELANKNYFKKETRNYVPKFIAILKIVRDLEGHGFTPFDMTASTGTMAFVQSGSFDLKKMASQFGLTWKEFRELNPAFRRSSSPRDCQFSLYLPSEKAVLAKNILKKNTISSERNGQRYKIRSGDSLWKIASQHGIKVSELKKLNGLKGDTLRPGQWLLLAREGQSSVSSAPAPVVSNARIQKQTKQQIARKRANYTVQQGDTIWKIARKFGTSPETLLVANGVGAKTVLRIGQKLYIPDYTGQERRRAKASAEQAYVKIVNYNVQQGDTIWKIARKFGTTPQALFVANGIHKKTVLRIGQKLYIPNMQSGETGSSSKAGGQLKTVNYNVQSGDTVWGIAKRFNVPAQSLLAWNNMNKRHVLRPGTNLILYLTDR